MITENLDAFLRHFGVPVSFEGAPVGLLGVEDVADRDVFDEESRRAVVIAGERVVTVRSDAVAALPIGAAITVAGVPYIARTKYRVGDGAFTVVGLRG